MNPPDESGTPDPSHGLTLSQTTIAQVRLLAHKPGVELDAVDQAARADIRAAHGGHRTEAEHRLDSAQREKIAEQTRLDEVRTRLKHAEPMTKVGSRKVGLLGWFVVLLLLGGLLVILYYENGASAQALLSTGAFDLDSIERARMVMLTPIAVGIAFILGFKVLPHFIRRTAFLVACGVLILAFLVWGVSFAIQTEKYRYDASQTISLGGQGDESLGEAGASAGADDGASAWLMFGSLVFITCLTTFIGHTGVEHFLSRYDNLAPNPEYTRALELVHAHEGEIRRIEKIIVEAAGQLEGYRSQEEQAVTQARSLYKWLKHTAVAIVLAIATTTGCVDGGAGGGKVGNAGGGKLQRWTSESSRPRGPVFRVIALSPLLPDAEKAVARGLLATEVQWIAEEASQGSVTVVVDGLNCAPVARLEAVRGVSRIRKKALVKPALAIREFLDRPHPRQKDDGRVHLPRLAQTLKQLALPAGTHVLLLGNPLFLNQGKDKFFSMTDGRVPSDGCLFEDPKLSLFSVVGRGKALAGQLWHLGWSDDSVFEDDTHRQAVLRFWSLYLKEQSAVLVTAQPSFVAAIEAAHDGATDPFMYADADTGAEPAMVKIVRVEDEEEREIKPKFGEDDARRAKAEAATEEAEAAARAAQRKREDEDAERRKTEEAGAADVKQKTPEVPTDRYGNLVGSEHDLIVDGQIKGDMILLGAFYNSDDVSDSPLGDALTKKGFNVERIGPEVPSLAAFERALDDSRQLWLWSSPEKRGLTKAHVQAIGTRWRAGKLALCLLADNTPFTTEASAVLAAVSPGSTIAGNYDGGRILHARQRNGGGFDAKSPLFHNVSALFEGRTISTMAGPGLVPACYASNGSPLIATLQRPGSSRLVVFGGYTSMFKEFWQESGISRFAANCAGWLGEADATKAEMLPVR